MRNLKKILALVLALMMVLSVMVTASASFTDAEEINPAYEEAIEVLTAAGVMNGVGNDKFAPKGTLDRASAAKLIAYLDLNTAIDTVIKCETVFTDVPSSHWASGYIAHCYDKGIVNGNSATTYNPAGNITVESYAKLLLGVLGIEGTYTGDTWYVAVRNNAIKNGLMAGMTYTWTADITREQAAQMTFNAMKHGGSTVQAGYIVDGNKNLVFSSYLEAYLIADSKANRVTPNYVTTGDLLSNFLVEYGEGTDLYGRPSTNYTYLDAEGKEQTLYYAESADFIYTAGTDAKVIAAEMKGYYVVGSDKTTTYKVEGDFIANSWNNVSVNTDGVAGALTDGGKLSVALAGLTDDNAIVEIFTNKDKAIEAIVVTNTKVGTVAEVIEATKTTPELVKIGSLYAVNIGLKEGDVVTYTVCGTTVENLAAAEYIVGTLTSYNSKGEYTINGEVYALALNAVSAEDTIRGKFGKEYAYYLGANDTIIYAAGVPGTETIDPVITDYVQIKDVNVVIDVTATTWPTASITVNSITAQAYVMTLDGSVTICNLPVKQASAAIAGTTVAKGDYYTTVGKTVVELYDAKNTNANGETLSTSATAALKAAYNSWDLFTYTVDGNTMTLVGLVDLFTGAETESGVAQRLLSSTITKTSTTASLETGSANTVILNNNTKFILKDSKGNIVVKTGVAALAATEITSARVVVDVTVIESEDKDGNTVYTRVNVADLVIADGTEFKTTSAPAQTVQDIVLVDGNYTTTKNEKNEDVYTYTVINVEGEVLSLTGAKDLTAGLYTYNSKNELSDTALTSTPALVGVIAGTTVNLGGVYYTVNDNAVITDLTGEGLETGAYVFYVLAKDDAGKDTNVVSNIFIIKAAE